MKGKNKMKRIKKINGFVLLCMIFFVFIPATVFSQVVINGNVSDSETKKPIKDVRVYVEKWNKGALTDQNGKYTLKLPAETITES